MSFEGMTKREAFKLIAVLRERVSELEAERAVIRAVITECEKCGWKWDR